MRRSRGSIRRIYVCEGAYFEDLALNAKHSSPSIFGGALSHGQGL
jgi:hypothetical protein